MKIWQVVGSGVGLLVGMFTQDLEGIDFISALQTVHNYFPWELTIREGFLRTTFGKIRLGLLNLRAMAHIFAPLFCNCNKRWQIEAMLVNDSHAMAPRD